MVSAQAPDGISQTNDVADQMMNSVEICPVETPWSPNSKAYTLYSGTRSREAW